MLIMSIVVWSNSSKSSHSYQYQLNLPHYYNISTKCMIFFFNCGSNTKFRGKFKHKRNIYHLRRRKNISDLWKECCEFKGHDMSTMSNKTFTGLLKLIVYVLLRVYIVLSYLRCSLEREKRHKKFKHCLSIKSSTCWSGTVHVMWNLFWHFVTVLIIDLF